MTVMEIDTSPGERLAVDEKPIMVPNKLIIKLKGGDNNHESVVHGDKEDRDDKPTCSLCGKTFPSSKSLFGHMRCHPDRDYRVMQPPDAIKLATSRSQPLMVVDDNYIDCMDLLRRLPGWSVKAKRRSVMEKGAIYALMLMATGDERYHYLDNDKVEDEDKVQKSSISNKKPRLVHGSTSDNIKFKTDPSGIESDNKVKDSELSDHQINNPADADVLPKCYKCSICDKTFATHQALGGHKSSAHCKHQFDHHQGIHDVFMSSHPPPPADATVSELDHICKTCDKAFPSGQALGGHMRRHWPGPAHPSSSTTTAEAKPVLVIDLNQPVADDTEEQE